jgi:hypothetical protein
MPRPVVPMARLPRNRSVTLSRTWWYGATRWAFRQQLEFVLFTAYDDGVPGVVAAVGLDDVVNAAAQKVSGLAFSFVAPLGSYDHNCWHGILPHSFGLPGSGHGGGLPGAAPFMRMPRMDRPSLVRGTGQRCKSSGALTTQV